MRSRDHAPDSAERQFRRGDFDALDCWCRTVHGRSTSGRHGRRAAHDRWILWCHRRVLLPVGRVVPHGAGDAERRHRIDALRPVLGRWHPCVGGDHVDANSLSERLEVSAVPQPPKIIRVPVTAAAS